MNPLSIVFLMITVLLSAVFPTPAAATVFSSSCPISDFSANPQALWLLCSEGRIAVTDDGGSTWREHQLGSEVELNGIGATDSERAFVAGDNGTLLVTRDGGQSWEQIPVPTQENLTSVSFFGEFGWVTGWGGVMLHSADGGRSWKSQMTNVSQALESVYFTDSSHGWAVGWVGAIIRTIDGGETWYEVRTPAALWSLSSVYFRDREDGWIVGFMGQILRSRDGGQTWETQESPTRSWLRSIFFDNRDRGWIAAESGVLLTEDGGESWRNVEIADRLMLTKLARIDGALVGASIRGLLKLVDGGTPLEEPQLVFAFGETRDSEPDWQAEHDVSTG